MSLLTIITSWMSSDIRTTLIGLLIGYLMFKLSKFYVRVYSLPPGPIPLPIVGNLLAFRGTKKNWSLELEHICEKYGPIMTLWMGNTPRIMITDIDIAREAFKKNDFAGRTTSTQTEIFINEKRSDIVFADYGHTWEALRRVAHSAVQKYSTTAKLNDLVIDCVDHTIDTIIENEGFDKPFVPFNYTFNLFLNIIAASAFGKRYDLDHPEYKLFKYTIKDKSKEEKLSPLLWEFFPLYKKYDKKFTNHVNTWEKFIAVFKQKFQDHYQDYDETVVRDFCDTLITAKNEALREGKETAPYLTDENLAMIIINLFFAGTDTSQSTFKWFILHMLYNKSIEKRLRQEIESEIGDRMPTHEDKNRCHYVMAFISETLRLCNVVPIAVPHKAIVTTKLGGYTIPEGSEVYTFHGHILHQSEHWPNPREFKPERFLENGKYLTTKPKAFIPFGVGRRVCLGEKLAIANLFLVLVRFLQKTSHYELILHNNCKDILDPDPDNMNIFDVTPKAYEISLLKK